MRTPEYAVMDGVVLEAGPASGYGLAVYIQHENGDVTVYGHMDKILVPPGQVVQAGDTIALLGNRGQSTGPHLHFEVHVGGLDGGRSTRCPGCAPRASTSESSHPLDAPCRPLRQGASSSAADFPGAHGARRERHMGHGMRTPRRPPRQVSAVASPSSWVSRWPCSSPRPSAPS